MAFFLLICLPGGCGPPQERPVTVSKGITKAGLRELRKTLEEVVRQRRRFPPPLDKDGVAHRSQWYARKTLDDLSTECMVYGWIKDVGVTAGNRLADCDQLIDPKHIREPSYFVSLGRCACGMLTYMM